jgi:hypothetical protein
LANDSVFSERDNRIVGPTTVIDADDDWEAARKAGDYHGSDDLQVWQANRFVIECRVKRDKAHVA